MFMIPFTTNNSPCVNQLMILLSVKVEAATNLKSSIQVSVRFVTNNNKFYGWLQRASMGSPHPLIGLYA